MYSWSGWTPGGLGKGHDLEPGAGLAGGLVENEDPDGGGLVVGEPEPGGLVGGDGESLDFLEPEHLGVEPRGLFKVLHHDPDIDHRVGEGPGGPSGLVLGVHGGEAEGEEPGEEGERTGWVDHAAA